MKLRRIVAAVLCAAVAFSCAGCADISKMGTVEGKEIPAGLYLWFENNAITEARTEVDEQLENENIKKADIPNFSYLNYNVQGKSFSDYVKERTLAYTKRYVAVLETAEKYEIKLTDKEISEINADANEMWKAEMNYYGYSLGQTYGEYYEGMGIGKNSYKLVQQYEQLSEKVFEKYYDEGGLTPTDEKDITTYYNDNYGRFGIVKISTSDAKDDETKKAEYKKLAEKYLDEIKSGTDYDEVLHEYEEYVEAKKKQEEEDKKNSSSDSGSSSSEVSSADNSAREAASDDESADDDTTTSDEEEEEEEEHDHDQLLQKSDSDTDKYNKFLFGLKVGESGIYEEDTTTYVVIRLDLLEREDWYDLYRSDLLHILKDADFEKAMDECAKDYTVDFEEAALNAYRPEAALNR